MKELVATTVILFSTMVSILSIAADQVEIMELKHTVAEEVILVIKPLLETDAVVTGKGHQLIVRAAPSSLDLIKPIIQRIDTPKRQLKISLRQLEYSKGNGRAVSASDSSNLDESARIILNENNTSSSNDIQPRTEKYSTQDRNDTLYEMQTTEGRVTFLRLGKTVPFELQRFITTGRRMSYGHNIGYKEFFSGLFVVPRVHGEFVSLEISSQRQPTTAIESGVIKSNQLGSVVRGRLGTWISLGAANQGKKASIDNSTAKIINTNNNGFSVQVKVELVR